MNALALEEPAPAPSLDAPLAAVLLADPGAQVLLHSERLARLRLSPNAAGLPLQLLLLRYDGLDTLETDLESIDAPPGTKLHVVVVGGDAYAGELLRKKIKPAMLQVRTEKLAYLLSISGQLETVRGAGLPVLTAAAKRLASGEVLDLHQVASARENDVGQAQQFYATLNARKPVVTGTLVGVSLAMFALQMWWGNGDPYGAAVRMGAALSSLIGEGQLYRLFTSTLLHGSLMHLVLNLGALVSFGVFLERFLGSRRYLALYVASALGGSVASFLHPEERLSVGASGGIWGLMVAGAVLVTLPRGKLPALVAVSQRARAWGPVAINAFYSFRPGIDLLAHFGGGLVGGLLMLTGLASLGIPGASDAGDSSKPPVRENALVSLLAAVSALALVVSLGFALVAGRPWELAQPVLHPVTLSHDAIELKLPSLMTHEIYQEHDGAHDYVLGALRTDPLAVQILVPEGAVSDDEAADPAELMKALLDEMKPILIDGFSVDQAFTQREHDGHPFLFAHELANDGRTASEYVRLIAGHITVVIVYTEVEAPEAWRAIAAEIPFTVSQPSP